MSSVSSVNSDLLLQQLQATQTSGSTQSTDSAKDAFAALIAQMMAGQNQATSTPQAAVTQASGSKSAVSSDMTSLSQALAAGNLSAAQQAFQSMQTDLQSALGSSGTHHHHKHHHAAASSGSDSSSSTTTTSTSTTTSTTTSASSIFQSSGANAPTTGEASTAQMISLLGLG